MDDQRVTDTTKHSVVSSGAYLLFYHRVHPERPQGIEQQSEPSSILIQPSLSYPFDNIRPSKSYPVKQPHVKNRGECEYKEGDRDERLEEPKYKYSYPARIFFSPPWARRNWNSTPSSDEEI